MMQQRVNFYRIDRINPKACFRTDPMGFPKGIRGRVFIFQLHSLIQIYV